MFIFEVLLITHLNIFEGESMIFLGGISPPNRFEINISIGTSHTELPHAHTHTVTYTQTHAHTYTCMQVITLETIVCTPREAFTTKYAVPLQCKSPYPPLHYCSHTQTRLYFRAVALSVTYT